MDDIHFATAPHGTSTNECTSSLYKIQARAPLYLYFATAPHGTSTNECTSSLYKIQARAPLYLYFSLKKQLQLLQRYKLSRGYKFSLTRDVKIKVRGYKLTRLVKFGKHLFQDTPFKFLYLNFFLPNVPLKRPLLLKLSND